MKPVLAAVGSATVAVLSQSSGIERPFFAMRRGHVVYNNCALYMLLYKQCRGFYCCSESSKREVCVPGTPSSLLNNSGAVTLSINVQVIKTFLKNVKECRDVIVEKVYKQDRDGSHTSRFDLIAPYIVVAYITVYA